MQVNEREPDERGPGRRAAFAFVAGIALLAVCVVLLRASTRPPRALGADAPAHVASAARALSAYTRVFAGADGRVLPHPCGSAAADDVRTRLVGELRALGLAPVIEEHVVLRGATLARVRNVVVPPRVRTERGAILLCAHYDSVAAGPGAGDDGAGVAALLEVARALHASPPARAHPVMYLFDDGEELGLLGAQAFVEHSAFARDAGVVVNLEARGTCGPSRMFETSSGNAELVPFLAASLPHPSANSLAYEIYKRMPNDTDLSVFKRAGLPGFNFAFVGGGRRYHTALDDLAHLDPGTLQHHAENALALVHTLAAHPGAFAPVQDAAAPAPSAAAPAQADAARARANAAAAPANAAHLPGDAVFTDLLGRVFVSWPAKFALWIALAPLLALVWIAWRSRRTHGVRSRALGRGAALACAGFVAAALVAFALDAVVTAVHGGVYPWPPDSFAAHASVFCAAAAVIACAAAFLLARAPNEPATADRALGAWLGVALVPAAAGVLCALTLPGACPPFVLPAFASAIVLAAARIGARRGLALTVVIAVALGAAQASLFVPLAQGIEEVVEFRTLDTRAVVLFAALFALELAPLGVLFAGAGRRVAFVTSFVFALASFGALAVVLATPATNADEPAPLFLAHVEREGESEARLYLRRFGATLPDDWAATAAFRGAKSENPFPWWPRSADAELARSHELTPLGHARWEIVESTAATEHAPRRVRVRLASQVRARHVVLELPRGVTLARVHAPVNGGVRTFDAELRGPRALDLVGFANDAVELELAIQVAEPVRAELLELRTVEHGPLRAWSETRPAGLAPRGEGDLAIGACVVTF